MAVWAISYATKAGVEIHSDAGRRIRVKSVTVGNQKAPDAADLQAKFFATLTSDDTVVSPAGANYTYLVGAYGRTQNVFWIDPGKLAAAIPCRATGRAVATTLLRLYAETPGAFYQYLPTDMGITTLRLAVFNWLNVEAQRVGDGNALTQLTRRERDMAIFVPPDEAVWVADFVSGEQRRLTSRLKAVDVTLSEEQKAAMKAELRKRGVDLFKRYFRTGKEDLNALEELIATRLAYFGVDELEADARSRVARLLKKLPENRLFDGLVGDDALRTKALLLALMRNPLFYKGFRGLVAYAGIGAFDGGQVVNRAHGERQTGVPRFRQALVFDFAGKYWQIRGIFRDLYYIYKAHQYYMYIELMRITQQVYDMLGIKSDDEPEADEEVEFSGEATPATIRGIALRLQTLAHLPLIARSRRVQREIEALGESPDAGRLWRLFTRASYKTPSGSTEHGCNLQMRPGRIEKQARRAMGTLLLQSVYYRWMAMLGRPVDLATDEIYCKQWRFVTGRTGVPSEYDQQIVLQYYAKRTAAMKATVTLSRKDQLMMVDPDERLEFFQALTPSQRLEVFQALSPVEQKKMLDRLPEDERPAYASLVSGKVEAEEEEAAV